MAKAGKRNLPGEIMQLPRARPRRSARMTGLQAAAAEPPRHQQCALCLELYKSPRILPCFHTFCLACLEQLVRSYSAAASFPCPTCRTAVQIPSGGVGKFQVNFYVEAAMENLQISQGDNTHVCDMCGEGNASSKCVDCDQFACDNCSKVHARIGTTKSHTVLNINAQSQNALVVKERFCATHTDEKIRFFCTQCRTVLCRDCKLTSHEGHSTTNLDQRSEKAKEMLRDVAKMSRNMTPKLKKSLQKAGKHKQDLAVKKTQILATFRTRADEIRKTIDSCLQQAEQNLSSESGKLEKELAQTVEDMQQQIASLESLCDHLEQVARVGCDADILSLPEHLVKFFGCNMSGRFTYPNGQYSQYGQCGQFQDEVGMYIQHIRTHTTGRRPIRNIHIDLNRQTPIRQPTAHNNSYTSLVCEQGESTAPFQVFTHETWCKKVQLENTSTHQQNRYYQRGSHTKDLAELVSEKIGNVTVISEDHYESVYLHELINPCLEDVRSYQSSTISGDIADIQSTIGLWFNSD